MNSGRKKKKTFVDFVDIQNRRTSFSTTTWSHGLTTLELSLSELFCKLKEGKIPLLNIHWIEPRANRSNLFYELPTDYE